MNPDKIELLLSMILTNQVTIMNNMRALGLPFESQKALQDASVDTMTILDDLDKQP